MLRETTTLFALSRKPLPRMTEAVRIGEAVRGALLSVAGRSAVPRALSGHDANGPASGHAHAFFLAGPGSGGGEIDHVIIHAAAGLDVEVLKLIDRLAARELYWEPGPGWRVAFKGTCAPGDAEASPLLGCSLVWESVTPYLHPWHRKRKGRFGREDQLRREVALRGLPALTSVVKVPSVVQSGQPRRALDFRRLRRKAPGRQPPQPDCSGALYRLEFAEPVTGPLALGFGCHFGLGTFRRPPASRAIRNG